MSRRDYEMAIKIAASLGSGFEAAFKNANKTIQGMGAELDKVRKLQAQAGKFQNIDTALAGTKDKLKLLSVQQVELAEKTIKTKDTIKALSQKLKEYKDIKDGLKDGSLDLNDAGVKRRVEEYGKLNKEMERQRSNLRSQNREYTKNEGAIKKASDSINNQSGKLRELQQELSKSGVNTKNLARENQKLAETYSQIQKSQQQAKKINAAKDTNRESMKSNSVKLGVTVGAAASLAAAIYNLDSQKIIPWFIFLHQNKLKAVAVFL